MAYAQLRVAVDAPPIRQPLSSIWNLIRGGKATPKASPVSRSTPEEEEASPAPLPSPLEGLALSSLTLTPTAPLAKPELRRSRSAFADLSSSQGFSCDAHYVLQTAIHASSPGAFGRTVMHKSRRMECQEALQRFAESLPPFEKEALASQTRQLIGHAIQIPHLIGPHEAESNFDPQLFLLEHIEASPVIPLVPGCVFQMTQLIKRGQVSEATPPPVDADLEEDEDEDEGHTMSDADASAALATGEAAEASPTSIRQNATSLRRDKLGPLVTSTRILTSANKGAFLGSMDAFESGEYLMFDSGVFIAPAAAYSIESCGFEEDDTYIMEMDVEQGVATHVSIYPLAERIHSVCVLGQHEPCKQVPRPNRQDSGLTPARSLSNHILIAHILRQVRQRGERRAGSFELSMEGVQRVLSRKYQRLMLQEALTSMETTTNWCVRRNGETVIHASLFLDWWEQEVLREDALQTSSLLLSPTDFALALASEYGRMWIESLGIQYFLHPRSIQSLVYKLRCPKVTPMAHYILKHLMLTPWNKTFVFQDVQKNLSRLNLDGRGLALPLNYGYGYLEQPQTVSTMSRAIEIFNQKKKLGVEMPSDFVIFTMPPNKTKCSADMRRNKVHELIEDLKTLGFRDIEIPEKRWEKVRKLQEATFDRWLNSCPKLPAHFVQNYLRNLSETGSERFKRNYQALASTLRNQFALLQNRVRLSAVVSNKIRDDPLTKSVDEFLASIGPQRILSDEEIERRIYERHQTSMAEERAAARAASDAVASLSTSAGSGLGSSSEPAASPLASERKRNFPSPVSVASYASDEIDTPQPEKRARSN